MTGILFLQRPVHAGGEQAQNNNGNLQAVVWSEAIRQVDGEDGHDLYGRLWLARAIDIISRTRSWLAKIGGRERLKPSRWPRENVGKSQPLISNSTIGPVPGFIASASAEKSMRN
jgi:hypothetical protein